MVSLVVLIVHSVHSVLLVEDYKSVNVYNLYVDSLPVVNVRGFFYLVNMRGFLNVILVYLGFIDHLVGVGFVLASFR